MQKKVFTEKKGVYGFIRMVEIRTGDPLGGVSALCAQHSVKIK